MGSVSKIMRCGLIDYEPTLIQFGSDILTIVAALVSFNGSFWFVFFGK